MIEALRNLLIHGPKTAKELYRKLGISQPSFSTLVNKNPQSILTIGKRRSTVYALIRAIRNLPNTIPIYQVSKTGEIKLIAKLTGIHPKGFIVDSFSPTIKSHVYEDLPYWLADLSPTGFLGRLIPKKHPELLYPDDIRMWSADDCLHYWYTLGWDLIGNIIIGDVALTRYQQELATPQLVKVDNLESELDLYSSNTIQFGSAGSSAGGEQAKFLCIIKTNCAEPTLVKFNSHYKDAVAKRRSDLLVCEHLALQTLATNGINAAESELNSSSERLYLKIKRFDRQELLGRRGIISLATLNYEYLGKMSNWVDISTGLAQQKVIPEALLSEIKTRYYFGLLIGNNDMHSGNLSFYSEGEKILDLAPVYDMLPMIYAPIANELPIIKNIPPTLPPQDIAEWSRAQKLAEIFYKKIAGDQLITKDFRAILLQQAKDFGLNI